MIKSILTAVMLFVFISSGTYVLADCPSTDFSGDCFVDFEDFAQMGGQWLNGYDCNDLAKMANQWLTTDPCVPDDMVYIEDGEFEMGDHSDDDGPDEVPVHAVLLDSFFMSKFEITNQQYCDYLNSAYPVQIKVVGSAVYASSDSGNSYPYCNMDITYSQIDYSGGVFSVKTKGEPPRDMNEDPMVQVSWYGSTAYCNWRSVQEGYQQLYDPYDPNWPCDFSKHGYRLPTEAEWEYAARGREHNPYYRFPWGDTISHEHANYYAYYPPVYAYDVNPTNGYHPEFNDGIPPYTAPVRSFSEIGYGLHNMTGNVWEWCNDWFDATYYQDCSDASYPDPCDNPTGPVSGSSRVTRGGCWLINAINCRISERNYNFPQLLDRSYGFRIVLSTE